MISMHSRWTVLALVLISSPLNALFAQSDGWTIGLFTAYSGFSGGARDPSGIVVEPNTRLEFGATATRSLGAWRLEGNLAWAPGHLITRDSTGQLLQLEFLAQDLPRYRAALLVGLRLTALGQGELLFLAGPTFDIWNGAGETRTRFGGQLRLALEAPLGPLRLQNYLGYSLSGSLFNASEFPPEIARTAQQVLSLGVEVRLRL